MSEKITTLHLESDSSVEVYPNIRSANIPSGAVTKAKMAVNSVGKDELENNLYHHQFGLAHSSGANIFSLRFNALLNESHEFNDEEEIADFLNSFYGGDCKFDATGLYNNISPIDEIDILSASTIRIWYLDLSILQSISDFSELSDVQRRYVDITASPEFPATDVVTLLM